MRKGLLCSPRINGNDVINGVQNQKDHTTYNQSTHINPRTSTFGIFSETGASRVSERVERSAPCAMIYPEYSTRGDGSTRHHRQKLRMVVFLLVVVLPVSTAFSSPATRSTLFLSQTRLRFIGRQISTSPTNFNTYNDNARSKNARQSTSTTNFANPDANPNAHHLFPDFVPHVRISRTDKISLIRMAVATALAFAGLLSVAGPGSWRYFAAGGICAATSHAITTPIDVVKVRLD
jgi:hypothetical protein